jgi:hypothetical protein
MNITKSKSKIRAIGFSMAVIIVYLLNSVLVGIVYGVLLGMGLVGDGMDFDSFLDNNSISFLATVSILSIIVFGIILYFKQKNSKKYSDKPFASLNGKFKKKEFMESIILFVGAFGITILWVILISFLSEGSSFYKGLLESHNSTLGSLVGTESLMFSIITVSIIVPIAEELFFRGLIYGRLRQAMKPMVAILISSIVFGIFHGNVVQGVYAFFIGCALALVYEKTDSLLLSIFGHALINAIGMGLPFLGLDKFRLVLNILSFIAIIPSIIIIRKWIRESRDMDKIVSW